MSARRVFFYVQHLLGIGHLARGSRIASALSEAGFDVTVVTGGMPVAGFPLPGMKHIALPALTSSDEGFSGLVTADGQAADGNFEEMRRNLLLEAFRSQAPDILIIEAFPFGRRQMRFELLPLLEAAIAATPRPLIASSIRDILQERTKPGRNEETVDYVNRYFDLVLVHGDPQFVPLEATFPLTDAIRDKIAYTGLVAPPSPVPSTESFDIVVSAGGGAAGRDLVSAAVDAAAMLGPDLRWLLITGPNLPAAQFDAAASKAGANMQVERFRGDFANLLAAARLSVSQAGYNTVCDVLQAGCRSVLVPFAAGGETEQSMRAERLAQRGLTSVLSEAGINGSSLAAAVGTALSAPAPSPAGLPLQGAQKTAALLAAY